MANCKTHPSVRILCNHTSKQKDIALNQLFEKQIKTTTEKLD